MTVSWKDKYNVSEERNLNLRGKSELIKSYRGLTREPLLISKFLCHAVSSPFINVWVNWNSKKKFANFHGGNAHTMAKFKLSMMMSLKELGRDGHIQL